MPAFFISSQQIDRGRIEITGPLLLHVRDSLRLRPGEELLCTDERRRRYRVLVRQVERHHLVGDILDEREGDSPSRCPLILAQAVLKADRMDWVIQKSTELGVAEIVPLLSQRVIVRAPAERLPHQRDRWQRIALEAAQQAERWDVPPVRHAQELSELLNSHPPGWRGLLLSERQDGQSLSQLVLTGDAGAIVLAVGPEGGWTEDERTEARERGWIPISLGGRILRAETAALAAISVVQGLVGELG